MLRIGGESQTGVCNVVPTGDDLGSASAWMARRGAAQMPPLASNVIDTAGEQLIRTRINSLTAADCQ